APRRDTERGERVGRLFHDRTFRSESPKVLSRRLRLMPVAVSRTDSGGSGSATMQKSITRDGPFRKGNPGTCRAFTKGESAPETGWEIPASFRGHGHLPWRVPPWAAYNNGEHVAGVPPPPDSEPGRFMAVSVRQLPVLQNWDCHVCGNCCKEYQVTL